MQFLFCFQCVSVSLPTSSRCKLESCLDLFIKEEILDGDEMPTCSKCKTRRKSTKSFAIQRFPKYLAIRKYPSMQSNHKHFHLIKNNELMNVFLSVFGAINRFETIFGNSLEQNDEHCGISNW